MEYRSERLQTGCRNGDVAAFIDVHTLAAKHVTKFPPSSSFCLVEKLQTEVLEVLGKIFRQGLVAPVLLFVPFHAVVDKMVSSMCIGVVGDAQTEEFFIIGFRVV